MNASTYTNHKCRCPGCTEAKRIRDIKGYHGGKRIEDILPSEQERVEAAIAFCRGDLEDAAKRTNVRLDHVEAVWLKMEELNYA